MHKHAHKLWYICRWASVWEPPTNPAVTNVDMVLFTNVDMVLCTNADMVLFTNVDMVLFGKYMFI